MQHFLLDEALDIGNYACGRSSPVRLVPLAFQRAVCRLTGARLRLARFSVSRFLKNAGAPDT